MQKLYALLLLCATGHLFAGTSLTMPLNYQNTARSFIVYLPTGFTQGQQLPVVFNLHGYTSNATQQYLYSQMPATADNNNFILVCPQGLNNSWNSGFVPPYSPATPDDVGFVSKIIDTLSTLYNINLNRVYACGMSNGGFQSYRMACDLENRIAAVASVTGSISTLCATNCNLSRKVPVLQIHGTLDPTVPYTGGTGTYGQEQLIQFWLNKNQCSTVSDTIYAPNTNSADNSTVQKIHYRSCNEGAEVWFFKVISGGHTWPGGAVDLPAAGNTNRDIDASQEIWDFFNRYTLTGPVGIAQQPETALQVYPNPASNLLQVSGLPQSGYTYSLYNTAGQAVLSGSLNSSSTAISLQSILPGMYVLHVTNGQHSTTQRVVKQ